MQTVFILLFAHGNTQSFLKSTSIERMAISDRTLENAGRSGWTFLTNHGHVLICIASDPGIRGRDIADRVGITERAAQAIIADLVEGNYVKRTRIGRRNHYEINSDQELRHPVEQPHSVGDLRQLVAGLVSSSNVSRTDDKKHLQSSK